MIFAENALPTDLFMYINESYSKEILKSVEQEAEVEPLDVAKLTKFGKEFTPDTKLDDFDTKVMEVLRSPGSVCFEGSDTVIYTPDDKKVAFYDKAAGRIFISPKEDEYPGDSYEELTKKE